MLEVKVKLLNDVLIINWQLAKIDIPLSEIVKVTEDDTYAGEEKAAIRIGFPYPTTERIVIKTNSDTYILYTSEDATKKKLLSLVKR
ncbi:SunI/YnzG family protein [Niallia sp. 01092]|uniref:SunI/YnzG family protein n=1 Tax=unclassified Niallia TaxID=2837522 RepID=UPI003FD59D52